MGLPVVLAIGTGIMSVVSGFAQAGAAKAQAQAQIEAANNAKTAADQNYALQVNATQRLNQEQAVAATGQTSDRLAQAQRNLATLQVVMGERGFSSNTFVGLANDIYNSESIDLSRIGINYSNLTAADRARIDSAAQDRTNTYNEAESRITSAKIAKSSASTGAWLNAFGSGLKIAGGYVGDQMKLDAQQQSYDRILGAVRSG